MATTRSSTLDVVSPTAVTRFASGAVGFRSVMLITNGTLLDRRPGLFQHLTGLVISLDALTMDPSNPLSKPAALPKVLENIALAKSRRVRERPERNRRFSHTQVGEGT